MPIDTPKSRPGRRALPVHLKRKTYNFSLSDATHAQIVAYATSKGLSASAAVEAWGKKLRVVTRADSATSEAT